MENQLKKNAKKILIFSTAYYPFVGGAEVAIKEITDRLSAQAGIGGFEFDLITAKMKRNLPFREKVGNVTVYRLGIGNQFLDKFIVAFEGWLFAKHLEKKKKYDVYWCMMVSFASGSAYIKNILSKEKIPIVLTLQEGDSEKHLKTRRFGLVDLSWKLALKRTKILTVISNYLGKRGKRLGFKGEVKLIPNGVDVARFTKEITLEERKQIREQWGFKDTDTILITSSRLNIKNGVGDVIEALAKLPENVKFVVCGAGELEEKLKAQTKDLNLEFRVKFLGFVSHDELPKLLKASDIFIRPSLSEGMGNSFIEAMATEIPVIATPVGGIVDFIKEGETGYLCEPENSNSIVDTVRRVISDPNKNNVVASAKTLAAQNYDWNKIAVQMKQVFDTVSM